MSKSTPTATVVRQWAESKSLISAGQRGRLGTSVIDAFNAEHPKAKYPTTYRPKAPKAVKHTVVVQRNGRKVPVTRALPVSEVRKVASAAGLAGKRGILTKAALDYAFTEAAKAPKA